MLRKKPGRSALAYRNTTPSCAEWMNDFNLPTFRARRAAVAMCYKIITAETRKVFANLFTINDRSSWKSNSLALVMPLYHIVVYFNSIVVRSIHAWNTLTSDTRLEHFNIWYTLGMPYQTLPYYRAHYFSFSITFSDVLHTDSFSLYKIIYVAYTRIIYFTGSCIWLFTYETNVSSLFVTHVVISLMLFVIRTLSISLRMFECNLYNVSINKILLHSILFRSLPFRSVPLRSAPFSFILSLLIIIIIIILIIVIIIIIIIIIVVVIIIIIIFIIIIISFSIIIIIYIIDYHYYYNYYYYYLYY